MKAFIDISETTRCCMSDVVFHAWMNADDATERHGKFVSGVGSWNGSDFASCCVRVWMGRSGEYFT